MDYLILRSIFSRSTNNPVSLLQKKKKKKKRHVLFLKSINPIYMSLLTFFFLISQQKETRPKLTWKI